MPHDALTTTGEEATARFLRDAGALREIHHGNLLAVRGAGTLPSGAPYLDSEAFGDATLAEVGVVAPVVAAGFAEQVLAGLAAAHSVGVVHGDVHAGVLRCDTASGQVKVGDFGVTALAGHAPKHRRPEVSGARAAPQDDIEAAGWVLQDLLGPARTEASTLDPVPPGIARVAERLLARDVPTAMDGVNLLRAALHAEGSTELTPETRRRRWIVAGLLAFSFGLVGLRACRRFSPPAEE